MSLYLAKIVFNINIDNGQHIKQFDEQTRLIEAKNMDDAFFKARKIGKKEEESFVNHENKTVKWQFIDVVDLFPLQEISDGEQVYSSTVEREDAHSFIQFIKQKSMLIQTKTLTFI